MDWTWWNQGLKREYDRQEHDRAAGGKPTERDESGHRPSVLLAQRVWSTRSCTMLPQLLPLESTDGFIYRRTCV